MAENSVYCCGYVLANTRYQIPADCLLGYWYNNTFIRVDEWDLAQYPNILLVMWSQREGYKQMPYGTYPEFYYNGQYYYSLTEAQQAKARNDEYLQYLYTVQATYSAPQAPDAVLPNPLAASHTVPPRIEPSSPAADSPPRHMKVSTVMRTCVLCKALKPNFKSVLGKDCCSECLLERYLNDNFTVTVGGTSVEWSNRNVFEVHNYLMTVIPEAEKAKMPSVVKLPPRSFICVGKNKAECENYPPQGHFAGLDNMCKEDGCPNTEHQLCKTCADLLTACPLCNSFVKYEELPLGCPPDCKNHSPNFEHPCPTCNKTTPRRKNRPQD